MPWRGPQQEGEFPTLGYLVADFIETACAIPDGNRQGDPFILTDEMVRFLLWFYRLDPDALPDPDRPSRAFVYDRGAQLVRPQKWGKGPFSSAVICAEAEGPVLFDGWDAQGEPVGRPWATPWIQVTAVSEDQTDNVWRALVPMIELGDLKADIPDTGETRINLRSGGRIEPVTSSARSRLGQRITFAVQDEAHSWTAQNGGRRLADNQRRNLAGMGGRWMETGNAWDPIEESVAQKTWESKTPGVYKDRSEPGPGSVRNKRERRKCMVRAYGDSARSDPNGRWRAWVDLDRIDSEVAALIEQGDPSQAERFFLNRDQSLEGAAFDFDKWKELADPSVVVADKELIVVGVDGARVDDAFALIATDVVSGHQWPLGIWEVPPGAPDDYEHPEHEIDGAMAEAFDRFEVWRVYADPWRGDTLLDRWIGQWGEKVVIRWFMNRQRPVAYAVRNFAAAIRMEGLTHDGDSTFARHIGQARKKMVTVYDDDRRQMWTISKDRPMSPRKIDAAAAAVLSWEARGDAIAAGAEKTAQKSKTLTVW